jgi:hypothetical protein
MKNCWVVCLIAFVAQVLTVTWRWGHSPTHRLRDWYEGSFQNYFIDFVGPWLIVFGMLTAIWLLITQTRKKRRKV